MRATENTAQSEFVGTRSFVVGRRRSNCSFNISELLLSTIAGDHFKATMVPCSPFFFV